MIHDHDWVQNFTEYEAVLICINSLHAWDAGGVTRAFQTYGFDDGSTPGNDSTFVHAASGVTVLYEGGIVAIVFAHGDLNEAFPDLFAVLNALGWTKAQAYHPPETMSSFLAEVGRAIPANMDFDIKPAEASTNIRVLAQGTSLLDRAQVSPSQMGAAEESFLAEMHSMNESLVVPLHASAPIALLDDDDSHSGDHEVAIATVAVSTPVLVESNSYSEEPIFFQLPATDNASDLEAIPTAPTPPSQQEYVHPEAIPTTWDVTEESELARDKAALVIPQVASDASQNRPAEVSQATPAQLQHTNEVPSELAVVSSNEVATPVEFEREFIHVGNSVFHFVFPSELAGLGEEEMSDVAQSLKVANDAVFDIRVGDPNSRWRWDVLNEVPSHNPSFAEKLVDLMEFNCVDTPLITCLLLGLKKEEQKSHLRALLDVAGDLENQQRLLTTVSANAAKLLSGRNDIGQIATAIFQRLGAFAYIPDGESFFDTTSDGAKLIPFTCTDIISSPERRLFVIRVDATDSPFVQWSAELLYSVAKLYASSAQFLPVAALPRQSLQVDQLTLNKVKEDASRLALGQVAQMLGGVVAQLNGMMSASEHPAVVD